MSGGSYGLQVLSMAGGLVRSSCGLEVATEKVTVEPTAHCLRLFATG